MEGNIGVTADYRARNTIDFFVTKCYIIVTVISDVELGRRIRTARENQRVTQAQLGRRLGYTSHVPVVNLEGGKTHVSVVELERIAQILRIPLTSLIPGLEKSKQLAQLPAEVRREEFSVSLRADGDLLPEERANIERLYEAKRKQRQDSRDKLLDVDTKSASGARALARHHLRELGVERPPVNLHDALLHWNIEYDEIDLGDRISGLLIRDWQLRLICVNKRNGRWRKRMTVAHELGHFHIGWRGLYCTTRLGIRDGVEEELAYEYANELLVPSLWLREKREQWERDPAGVAMECQVSPIALERWAARVGLSLPNNPAFKEKHMEVIETWERRRQEYRSTKKEVVDTFSQNQQPRAG
ncbi:MAG: ImmA/IrrE family metallo-endopeptidase [Chloroflexi bacterium]|nr:ImmA/IrrE family metallo-endopeptidase [Chloroflexota bacterium]